MGGPAVRSIAVTSCHRGEGRSTVALALALLERTTYDRRTLLVELDLERPWLANALGLPDSPGVADVLRDETSVESALRWTDGDLAVLSAGDPRGVPAALLAQVVTGDLLDGLGELFDTLIVDLPPLEGTGSAALVARRCSTPLLVVRAGAAEMRDIKKAAAMFDVPPPILMNGVSPRHAQTTRRSAWVIGHAPCLAGAACRDLPGDQPGTEPPRPPSAPPGAVRRGRGPRVRVCPRPRHLTCPRHCL